MSKSIVSVNKKLADAKMHQMLLERDPDFVWESLDRVQKLYLEALNCLKVGASKHIKADIDFLIKNTAIAPDGTMYMECCFQMAVTSSVKGFNVSKNPKEVFESSKKHIERWIMHEVDFGRLEFKLFWSYRGNERKNTL